MRDNITYEQSLLVKNYVILFVRPTEHELSRIELIIPSDALYSEIEICMQKVLITTQIHVTFVFMTACSLTCPPTLGKHHPCFPQLPARAHQFCQAPFLSLPYVSISTIQGHPTRLKIHNSQTNERRGLKFGRYIF